MDQILDSKTIALLLTLLVNSAMGFLIYWRGRKNLNNISFGLFVLAIVLWIFGMIVYRIAPTASSVFWCKVLYINATFTSSFFLLFTYIFPFSKLKLKKWQVFLIFIPNVFLILAIILPDLIIKQVIIRPGQEKLIIFGFWYFLYTLYILVYFFVGFWNLFKAYRISSGNSRTQLRYVFLGFFISANIAFSTNLLMPWWGQTKFNWLGQITTLIWVGLTTYAIVVHRLMDIKLVLRRSIVYILSVLATVAPASGVLYIVNLYWPQYITYAAIATLVASVSVFSPIRNYYYRIANKYFFSSLYDSREVIARVSDGLRSTLDVGEIYNLISGVLINSFHAKAVGILNYDEDKREYIVQFNNGFALNGRKNFPGDSGLQEEYGQQLKVMIVEEIKNTAYDKHKEIIDLLTSVNAAAVARLVVQNETLGLIILGAKESGDMYNDEDLRTLSVISSQAAIAIKNAQLYDETKKFSDTLQKEVERQTGELKRANIELQKLDKAKSDFISIASHQLRSPLSVIKGFTSMMMEGTYGKVSQKILDKLSYILHSNERLIRLVDDLLDLSHMEGGQMK